MVLEQVPVIIPYSCNIWNLWPFVNQAEVPTISRNDQKPSFAKSWLKGLLDYSAQAQPVHDYLLFYH